MNPSWVTSAVAIGALCLLAAPLSHAQITLPVTFEDGDAAFYELTDFGSNASSLVADPTDATNTVVESVRTLGAACFAGTTVADDTGFTSPIPFAEGATTMSVRVWSPEAGIRVLFKVEKFDTPQISVETLATTTMAGAWETLVFDFANERTGTAAINFASTYDKASIFFDFSCDLTDPPAPPERTYYWDDVAFGGDAGPSSTPIADVRAAGTGMEFTIEGVVTRAMGAFSYVQDATGAITIRQTSGDYFDDVADGTIAPGTQVTITGTTSEFRGLFQINGGDLASYSVDGTTGVPAAQVITLAELTSNGEAYEGELVQVSGLTTSETGTFAAATTYTVGDGTADGPILRIPNANDSMIDGTDILSGPFTFTGVVGQFTFADPATDGYQLLAIAPTDIEADPVPVVSLPVFFEDDIDYELNDFGGNTSQLVEDPEDASNTVVESVRGVGAALFAGTTVADVTGFTAPIPFAEGATTMNVKVWTPVAGTPVRLKVEQVGVPEVSVEAQVNSTKSGEWEVLVFDFVVNKVPDTADINFASTYTKASIFFDFGLENATATTTYYWDDLAFGSEAPVSEEGGVVREDVMLTQNHPNPFSEQTTIQFTLPTQDHVQIEVYNQLGQRVATLVDGPMGAGPHAVPFDASGLASGTYFYRLTHSDVSITRTMVLTR